MGYRRENRNHFHITQQKRGAIWKQIFLVNASYTVVYFFDFVFSHSILNLNGSENSNLNFVTSFFKREIVNIAKQKLIMIQMKIILIMFQPPCVKNY